MAARKKRVWRSTGKPRLGGGGAEPLALPPVREDLRLYPGPPQRDGSPTWRILDPIRNSFFEIGWLEFELLARWREHKDAAALAAHVAAETPISPSLEEVREMIGFLTTNQLLAVAQQGSARGARPPHEGLQAGVVHGAVPPLPVLPPSAVSSGCVSRAHRRAGRRLLHARFRAARAGAARSRPLPALARVVQRHRRGGADIHAERLPLLRDRRHLLEGDPRAGARLCRAPLRRARADHRPRVPGDVAVPVHRHRRDLEAGRPPQAAGHRLRRHERGAGAGGVLDAALGALPGRRREERVLRARQHHLGDDAGDQPQPVHALRRLLRAVGPARLPEPARARHGLREVVAAQDLLRPRRADARARAAAAGSAPG